VETQITVLSWPVAIDSSWLGETLIDLRVIINRATVDYSLGEHTVHLVDVSQNASVFTQLPEPTLPGGFELDIPPNFKGRKYSVFLG
jgi:hypothetical protein